MLLLQTHQKLSVVREPAEILHRRSAGLAFRQVAGGVAVAFGFAAVEGVGDHGAAQKGCGKRLVGLERVGGIMVYDVTNPKAPGFVQYLNYRDFGATPGTADALDLGPEGIRVIAPEVSPLPGVPLLAVANEVSGTTTLFRIERERLVGASPR